MIVRILGDGQYELPEDLENEFDKLDNALVSHVEAGNEEAFRSDLAELVGIVRRGEELTVDVFRPSDAVVPSPHASLADVQELLAEEQASS